MGRGRRRLTCAVSAVVGLLGVGSSIVGLGSDAGAVSPTWQSRTIPWTTAGPVQATITGVSCASATKCVAVGTAPLPETYSAGIFVANLERGTWVQGLLPLPDGGFDGALNGVSCPTATNCIGVGYYGVDSGGSTVDHALVEIFADGTWTPWVGLDPAGASTATLTGVSCSSKSVCQASGTAQSTSGPGPYAFVTGLAGGVWTAVVPALPTGVTSDSLAAISCAGATHCAAVGTTDLGEALMEVDVAGKWTPSLASTVSGSTLASVSCSAPGACVAVGENGSTATGFAEQLAGKAWTTDSTLPSSAILSSVSCVGASLTCTAWGEGPVVETLSSGVWSQVTATGLPYGGYQGLVGTCTSTSACQAFEAVGSGSPGGVAVLTDAGGTWTSDVLPGPADAALQQVSCSTVTCVGVGTYYNSSGQEYSTILDLEGGQWIQVAYPLPTLYLYDPSVSCVGKTCVVLSGQSAAVSTNGTSWTVQSLPIPTGYSGSIQANALSCWAAAACMAVGNASGDGSGLLAETLSAGTWTATLLPSTLGFGGLSGISCFTATSCTAVGDGGNLGIESLVETLVGTTWTQDLLPAAAGATYGSLSDVSCTSANDCVAVGDWFPSYGGSGSPLAAVLSTGTWTQTEVPSPGETVGGFSSVSCPAKARCDATVDGQAMQLAHGAWSTADVPLPAGAMQQDLSSVRCIRGGWCVIAGDNAGAAPLSGEAQESPMIATSGAPVPVITSGDTATATVGVRASITLQATSVPVASFSVSGTLPAGFKVVEHGNGTATLQGKATAAEKGTYPLTVVADNGVGAPATQAFSLTVS